MRTYVRTFVTLDTVIGIPSRNKGSHTTFFVLSCALHPCAIFDTFECRNFQQVAILSVDRTNNFVDECWVVVWFNSIVFESSPCWVNSKLFVFATTVNSSIIFVYNIFTFFAIRFEDEFLHLLDSKVNRNYFCNTEECRLKDSVSAVAKTDFLSNSSSIDIVNSDIVLSEIAFHFVWQVFSQFFVVPYSIQKECTILLQTTSYVVHTEVSLNVASYEVRCCHQICRTDRCVAKTEVRTCETTRFFRVVREISLTIFICIVANDFD